MVQVGACFPRDPALQQHRTRLCNRRGLNLFQFHPAGCDLPLLLFVLMRSVPQICRGGLTKLPRPDLLPWFWEQLPEPSLRSPQPWESSPKAQVGPWAAVLSPGATRPFPPPQAFEGGRKEANTLTIFFTKGR